MAKQKRKVFIDVIFSSVGTLIVYCDRPREVISEVAGIEGVRDAFVGFDGRLLVLTDPRYDVQEVITEIEELLTAEVPDVFREGE